MPLIHSPAAPRSPRRHRSLWADVLVLLLVGAVLGGLILIGQRSAAPYRAAAVIDLSPWSLPHYAALSLSRCFAAYFLSLVFTLVYGTVAAHNPHAERAMIPALDVLQAIPVLGFLPALVLAMIALFPTRGIGLELASIVMIFTGQVWNMTFSYYASLKEIPLPLREAAAIQGWTRWQTLRRLEIPSAMIGLVWNSMMSMAGGWFFLAVTEAFTLQNRDYRLPGIGSYMNEAIRQGNSGAIVAAIIAMILVLLAVDQVVWRPLIAWSERFKMEETAEAAPARSWALDVIESSRFYQALQRWRRARHPTTFAAAAKRWNANQRLAVLFVVGRWAILIALGGLALSGLGALVYLLSGLPLYDPAKHNDWCTVLLALGASFLRTTAAVLLGAVWTLPAGILIGRSPHFARRMEPLIQMAASFPAPMIYPNVAMLLAALHVPFTLGCVALMLLGSQWYILFNVLAGAMAIPSDLKEVAEVYRWSHWRRWTSLYIPAVFPYLVTGLITAAGGAWNATIVSEYLQLPGTTQSAFGLGSTISRATAAGNYSLLCAAVVTMAAFVVLLNRLFWKRLYHLAEKKYSLEV